MFADKPNDSNDCSAEESALRARLRTVPTGALHWFLNPSALAEDVVSSSVAFLHLCLEDYERPATQTPLRMAAAPLSRPTLVADGKRAPKLFLVHPNLGERRAIYADDDGVYLRGPLPELPAVKLGDRLVALSDNKACTGFVRLEHVRPSELWDWWCEAVMASRDVDDS